MCSINGNVRSMPAEVPAEVQIFPSLTIRSSTTSTSLNSRNFWSEAQCVVAHLFESRPARWIQDDCVGTESTALQFLAYPATNWIRDGLSTSLRAPSPPGTRRKSNEGQSTKVAWGLIGVPLLQIMGSGFSAIMRQFWGAWANLLQSDIISHGPTRSSSSSPGKLKIRVYLCI